MKVLVVVAAALILAAPAAASEIFAVDATDVTLRVNGATALVSYTANGKRRHLLAWGAINANPALSEVPQTSFRRDYSGGWKSRGKAVWATFANRCGPYAGPALPFVVVACTARDGTNWAIQAWQRLLPMRGFDPWKPGQAVTEFHLSHWSGPVAVLEVSPNWTYGGRWQGLFGRLTYSGAPVFGTRTPTASRRDAYGRYVYIDTRNSVYGPGWKHDAGKVLHLRNGAFCYSFVPQVPPPGYPDTAPRGPAVGDLHRVTVMGPGVTPDVQWEGAPLGRYDEGQDDAFNALFDRLVGPDDRVCSNER
ncbi:MAG TPA: hypothetical protein VH620_03165 [Gaiella sp.]